MEIRAVRERERADREVDAAALERQRLEPTDSKVGARDFATRELEHLLRLIDADHGMTSRLELHRPSPGSARRVERAAWFGAIEDLSNHGLFDEDQRVRKRVVGLRP